MPMPTSRSDRLPALLSVLLALLATVADVSFRPPSAAAAAADRSADERSWTVRPAEVLADFYFKAPRRVRHHEDRYYVLDEGTHRIVVFGEDWEQVGMIGGIGQGRGEFFHPTDFDLAGERLYVLDAGNHRVQILRLDGTPLAEIPDVPKSHGFAVTPSGEVLLGQPQHGRLVSVYSPAGEHVRSFGALLKPSQVYGREYRAHDKKFSLTANRVHLATDGAGHVYVAFLMLPLLQRYSPDGDLLFESSLEGRSIDWLHDAFWNHPTGSKLVSKTVDGFAVDMMTKGIELLGDGRVVVLLGSDRLYVARSNDGRRVGVVELEPDPKGWLSSLTFTGEARLLAAASIFNRQLFTVDLAALGAAPR